MNTKRVTVEEVCKAYEKIGYKPIKGEWVSHEAKECCPLSAILIAEGLNVDDENIEEVACEQFGSAYVMSFIETLDEGIEAKQGDTEEASKGCADALEIINNLELEKRGGMIWTTLSR